MENNNRSKSHAVFNIKLHIVFVTKYRRKTLIPEVLDYLKEAFSDCLEAWECKLVEFGGEPDHVHLLIDIHPALDISVLINNLKTASARRTRNRFTELILPSFSGLLSHQLCGLPVLLLVRVPALLKRHRADIAQR